MCVFMCPMCLPGACRGVEDIQSPGTGVLFGCGLPRGWLGTEPKFATRAPNLLLVQNGS